ncbi:C40 family peptidase [Denitratisoma oestradiolicum]|nr:C40 family peptidase [Denitratisoma oestradiolicum]TWO79333.1 hypothetical protein CBW56_15610 [Denitratisoma oestradiolicum]
MFHHALPALLVCLALSACGPLPGRPPDAPFRTEVPPPNPRGLDVAIFALGLVETGYRFGGKNPESGLDCSGMVSYVFDQAAGLKLTGSAAEIARKGRPVEASRLRPGDLVFFNTRNQSLSHVGIYIGDNRFVHAPSTNGKVRADRLNQGWFASRFETARSYFD